MGVESAPSGRASNPAVLKDGFCSENEDGFVLIFVLKGVESGAKNVLFFTVGTKTDMTR